MKKVNGRNKYIRNWSRQWYLLVMNKSKATEQHIGKRDRQREKKKVTARKQTWQWDFRTSNVSKCSMIKKELKLNEFYFISLIHSFIFAHLAIDSAALYTVQQQLASFNVSFFVVFDRRCRYEGTRYFRFV